MQKEYTKYKESNKCNSLLKDETRKICLVKDTLILGEKNWLNRRGLNGGDGPYA